MSRKHSQENLFKHVEIENCDNSSAVFDEAGPLEHSDRYRYAGAPDRRKDVLNGMDRIAHHSVLNEMPRQQRAHADAGPA